MYTIHIINSFDFLDNLLNVLGIEVEDDTFEIVTLDDELNLGPLRQAETSFTQTRNGFQSLICAPNESPLAIEDVKKVMAVSTQLSNDDDSRICFWQAANAADLCTYYWLLHHLKKHQGRLDVINISGLPFLDDDNQLFMPDRVSELPRKEVLKALKLRRKVTATEWEIDGDEWVRLMDENANIRRLSGEKKLVDAEIDYYDGILLKHCTGEAKRTTTILKQALKELKHQVSETFLQFRLRALMAEGKVGAKPESEIPISEDSENTDSK